jgi:hypothetical protein
MGFIIIKQKNKLNSIFKRYLSINNNNNTENFEMINECLNLD